MRICPTVPQHPEKCVNTHGFRVGRLSHTVPHVPHKEGNTNEYEIKQAEENGFQYIPPYKLAEMMKVSGKIVKILTENTTAVTLCYDDMKVVMRIVDNVLSQGIQKGGDV